MVVLCSDKDWHEVIRTVAPGVRLLGIISNDDNDETPWFRIKIWVLDEEIAKDCFEYWNYEKRKYALKQFRAIRCYTDFWESEYGDFRLGNFITDKAGNPETTTPYTTMKAVTPSFNKLMKEIADAYR